MPKPLAICIEDTGATTGPGRYLRCVALVGRQPGLRLDGAGEVLWRGGAPGCELWVSADDQLMLFRPAGVPVVQVHRRGRSIVVPEERPVVLLDQDELQLDARRLRIHVHGEATAVTPPSLLPDRPEASSFARLAIGAALALGAAVSCSGADRANEPGKPPTRTPAPDAAVQPAQPRDAAVPIEVRMVPPSVTPSTTPMPVVDPPPPPSPPVPRPKR